MCVRDRLGVDENDELIDPLRGQESSPSYGAERSFEQMILENLQTAGVQQAHKEDKITFNALTGWPGELICAEGRYLEAVSYTHLDVYKRQRFRSQGLWYPATL